MRFSILACITLAAVTVASSSDVEDDRSSNKSVIEGGWEVVKWKSLFDKPSQVAGALYGHVDRLLIHQGAATVSSLAEKLGSLSASAQTLYDGLHFPNAGKSCWDNATSLGPNIQGCTDEFFQRAGEFYPSDKMTGLRKSVDSIASTATNLYQVVKGAAEQRSIPLRSILQELGNTFNALFEELKEQFPPPEEAPDHEKRMAMFNTVLDRVEESFLHVAIKAGASEELLRSHTSSLKSGVKHVVVTIGDAGEEHPWLAWVLVQILMWILLGIVASILPAAGLLLPILHIVGFGPLGPVKGGVAAWLQAWLYGPTVPKGSLFAILQRLAMTGARWL